ncbi:MAG: hypothetical protein WDO15_25440 [Bacteroidota bacterium]
MKIFDDTDNCILSAIDLEEMFRRILPSHLIYERFVYNNDLFITAILFIEQASFFQFDAHRFEVRRFYGKLVGLVLVIRSMIYRVAMTLTEMMNRSGYRNNIRIA